MSRSFPYLTRRHRDTSPQVAAAVEPAALSIDHNGVICDCNETAKAMFGLRCSDLLDRHIALLLPDLADVEWIQMGRPNHRLTFLSHIGHRFEAMHNDGSSFPVQIFLNDLGNCDDCTLRLVIRRVKEAEHGRRSPARAEPEQQIAATFAMVASGANDE